MRKLQKYKYVIIVLLFLGAVILLAGKFDLVKLRKPIIGGPKTVQLCYFKADEVDGVPMGEYNMTVEITGDKVEGKLNFLPAKEDLKTGPFKGQVTNMYSGSNEREAELWWETSSDGFNTVTEELKIIFNADVASVGFGVMTKRADGVLIYKNPDSVAYILTLLPVPCKEIKE